MGGFLTLRIVYFLIVSSKRIGTVLVLGGAISTAEMRTHLVSVDYNSGSFPPNYDINSKEESFKRESIKIESQNLYDTAKHATGYDSTINLSSSRPSMKDISKKQNISAALIKTAPRKSAVIQAITRKVRGPGADQARTASPTFLRSNMQSPAQEYGKAESTTTIVYATSIPTSKTNVNIRPTSFLQSQKYHLAPPEEKEIKTVTIETPKKVFDKERDNQSLDQKKIRTPIGSVAYNSLPIHREQGGKNSPGLIMQTNEDIVKLPSYHHTFSSYHSPNEDFLTRIQTSPQIVLKNIHDTPDGFYGAYPAGHDMQQYAEVNKYEEEPHRSISSLRYAAQPSTGRQHQRYQPLTIRDFELLLQLLVLKENRIIGHIDRCQLHNSYPSGDSNIFGQPIYSNGYSKNRDNDILRALELQSSDHLLPSNVREELLYRMLLLALQMQSMPKLAPPIHTLWPSQYMQIGPPGIQSTPRQHRGFHINSSVVKKPVRSVQILGEI